MELVFLFMSWKNYLLLILLALSVLIILVVIGALLSRAFLVRKEPRFVKQNLDKAGRSDLHYAARDGDARKAARLIMAGADVNLRDSRGYTPLHFAAQEQKVEVAKVLLDGGAKIDEPDNDGNTPLSNAVFYYRGDGSMIQLLRARGADAFAKNQYGVSAIDIARDNSNPELAKYFEDLR